MTGRLSIDDVSPLIDCGRFPAKSVTGEHIPIEATVWRDGHDAVAATVVWRGPRDQAARQIRMTEVGIGLDRWTATIVPDDIGMWSFRVDAWGDPWHSWLHAIEVKVAAGQSAADIANDLEDGARLLERVARRPNRRRERPVLTDAANSLRAADLSLEQRIAPALSEAVRHIMHEFPVRELVTKGKTHQLWVDRQQARFSAWYELFPRSTGGIDEQGKAKHGTFGTAEKALDRISDMGFDVVYLPPIHPIGKVNRKGPNNSLVAKQGDIGSPWAIGSDEGGHDAIHPDLGTLADFAHFVGRAKELDLEVALDLALQCAPDHPWAREHPEWFRTRPDGTIAYAENPPKKYQDIYPVNFDTDPEGIYAEVLRVVLHWVEHGVRIFRVDNPHTKPPDFWHWLIWQVKQEHPDVLFLSEAFTRPAIMYGLARRGFTQYYSYFTWRTTKHELIEFGQSLVQHCNESTPNLFVNTPDILHASLQHGGPAMFAIRAALAATLSPSWGVYSGYELYESTPVRDGSEEYLDSEKYQLRPRDFAEALTQGRSLEPWLRQLNQIRRAHPALHQLRTLMFHYVDNDALLAYSKQDPATGDTIICVINLDHQHPQQGTLSLDLSALGMSHSERFAAYDEVTGENWDWGQHNFIRLEPHRAVAHVVSIARS